MGLEIPAEVQWLSWIVGSDWPEGDETAMRRCAEAWIEAATQIDVLTQDLQGSAAQVLSVVEGEAAERFRTYWETYTQTDPQFLVKLAEACQMLGKSLDE